MCSIDACYMYLINLHITHNMSPALNGSSVFEHGNMVKICNRMMSIFYPGLPHTLCSASHNSSFLLLAYPHSSEVMSFALFIKKCTTMEFSHDIKFRFSNKV